MQSLRYHKTRKRPAYTGHSGEDFVCPRELVYTEIDLYLVVLDSLDITGITNARDNFNMNARRW